MRGKVEKIIAKTSKWTVTLKGTSIEITLNDLVFSDREVMAILDAYKLSYAIRHREMFSMMQKRKGS